MTAVPVAGGGLDQSPPAGRARSPVLVVGLDGSAPSWDAFSWVAGEALRSRGRVVAVYVTPLADLGSSLAVASPLCAAAVETARNEIAGKLAGEVAKRADELGVEASFVRAQGDIAQALGRVARTARADIVAVGRSAKARHRLAGSLARRLALGRDLPVVVVVP
jgi:nucleotide-binding universal stress UspA family protein